MPTNTRLISPPAAALAPSAVERPLPLPAEFPGGGNTEVPVSVGHYFWLLRRAWWKIALATTLSTGLAGYVAHRIQPLYESTARVAVDPEVSNTVMGDHGPVDVAGSETEQFFNTELELIQSDAVLRPVAQQFHLLLKGNPSAPPDAAGTDAPVLLPGLSVVHPANSFLITISYRSHDPRQAAAIANAITHSFSLRSHTMRADASREESEFIRAQLGELKQKMDDSALALAAYEKQLGVINPDEKTSILESRLGELNTAYTEAQNDRMQKEVDLRALQTGSTAALEVSPQATPLSRMEDNLHAAQGRMEAVKGIYGSANPEYKQAANALQEATHQYEEAQHSVAKRIEMQFAEARHHEELIGIAVQATKSEFDSLNAHSVEYQELKREAESNKTLYAELFRKVQEARINAAFQGSPIRVFDQARPGQHPVFPKKSVFLCLGFLLSMLGSILVVVIADLMDKTLRDPFQVHQEIGVDVIGILPHVRKNMPLAPTGQDVTEILPAHPRRWFASPEFETAEFYGEAVSALLSTIRVSRFHRNLRSVLVTSPNAGEGKSTCIAHLAAAHARQGNRTLLIDADLRCPTQHLHFAMKNTLGLADAVTDNKRLQDLKQQAPGNPNLDVIVAAQGGSAVIERVGKAVEDLLAAAHAEYDLVFIDAPPMLCFAEPIHLAGAADGVLVICRAGHTSKQEVSGVFSKLRRLGAAPLGLVLNQVHQKMSVQYGGYQSYYRRKGRIASAA